MKKEIEEIVNEYACYNDGCVEKIAEAILSWHKRELERMYHLTMDECTKTMGSISFAKNEQPYKMKSCEELIKELES